MDHEALASELMRALRAHRSQVAFSRRLGYRSNVAYAWESGRRAPTADEAMRAAARCGHDLDAALSTYRRIHLGPEPLGDLREPDAIARLLRVIQGDASTAELARRCEKNRHAVARWLSGETRIRLPDFLSFLEHANRSALTFVSGFVDPKALPSAREAWERVEAMGALLVEHPETLLIFVGLGLADYQELPRHEPGWLAARLGISAEAEARALAALRRERVIQWTGRRWRIDDASELDTRLYPQIYVRIRQMFASIAGERIGQPGTEFNYVLMSVEEDELEELYDLQRELLARYRKLAIRDRRAARVVLVTMQIAPL